MIKEQEIQENHIESIWNEYHDRLLSFILNRVNNSETAKDILQDVFIKMLNGIDALKDVSRIQSWMFQITRNAVIDHYRAGKPKDVNILQEKQEQDTNDGNVNDEVESWLMPLITSLPEKYRQAVLLCDIKGMSQKEFAQKIGISYEGAKSRVQRGRTMLKKKLTQCCCFLVDKYGNVLDYSARNKCTRD